MGEQLTYTSGALEQDAHERFEACLRSAREQSPGPFGHLIAGETVADGEPFEHRDPSDLQGHASHAYEAGEEIVKRAVEAARAARMSWTGMPYRERCERLRAAASALAAREVEIAAVVSLETGKTRTESIAEARESVALITAYCDAIEAAGGFTAPLGSSASEHSVETLRPYGVFGAIAPFNFPIALAVNMTAAALVTGNTVVLKPSEAAPWTAHLLGEAMAAAELPPGAFNLVHGGERTGRALAKAAVDGIAFTGSVPAGREIAAAMSSGSWQRPVLAEMGGKNPAVVTARADVEKAAEGVARAAFGLSGQKCSACSRAIVLDRVYDEFMERLVALAEGMPVGDPGDRLSALGPVIDEGAVARFEDSSAMAARDGTVAAGGRRAREGGHFVQPTVVCDLPTGHPLTRKELFLPFVAVTRAADLDAAIAEANAVEYGLTAGVFSEDEAEVQRFLDRIEAGVLYVNRRAGATTGAWPGAQSFCGWKASGFTGKGGLGPYYLPQFMREQSRTFATEGPSHG